MLRIRLQRTGRKKSPFYKVVVAEKSSPIKGRVVDRLGFYNPLVKPWSFEVDTDKVSEWIGKGAQPTNTVARLLKAAGVEGMDKFILEMADRKKKNAPDEPEAPAAAPVEQSEEPTPSSDEKPAEDSAADSNDATNAEEEQSTEADSAEPENKEDSN